MYYFKGEETNQYEWWMWLAEGMSLLYRGCTRSSSIEENCCNQRLYRRDPPQGKKQQMGMITWVWESRLTFQLTPHKWIVCVHGSWLNIMPEELEAELDRPFWESSKNRKQEERKWLVSKELREDRMLDQKNLGMRCPQRSQSYWLVVGLLTWFVHVNAI